MEIGNGAAGANEGWTIIGLIGSFAASVAAMAWRGRGLQADLEAKITKTAETLRAEALDRRDEIMRIDGDAVDALKTKVMLMELEVEKTFVRRQDFQNAIDMILRSLDAVRADIKGERAEIKADYIRLSDQMNEILRSVAQGGR